MAVYYDRYRDFRIDGQVSTLPFIKLPIKGSDKKIVTDKKTRFDKISQQYLKLSGHIEVVNGSSWRLFTGIIEWACRSGLWRRTRLILWGLADSCEFGLTKARPQDAARRLNLKESKGITYPNLNAMPTQRGQFAKRPVWTFIYCEPLPILIPTP